MLPIKYVFPLFLFNQMLAAVMRNDGDPGRATAAVRWPAASSPPTISRPS